MQIYKTGLWWLGWVGFDDLFSGFVETKKILRNVYFPPTGTPKFFWGLGCGWVGLGLIIYFLDPGRRNVHHTTSLVQ